MRTQENIFIYTILQEKKKKIIIIFVTQLIN